MPKKVEQIADAIRRDNPPTSDAKAYAIANATYQKMGGTKPKPAPKKK